MNLLRNLVRAVLPATVLASALPCAAVNLVVDLQTGETGLYNPTASPISLAAYSVESPTSALNQSGWSPIAGRLDAAGNGDFDNAADWITLSPDSQSGLISEGAVTGAGGTLSPGELLSIGDAWVVGSTQTLTGSVLLTEDDGGDIQDFLQSLNVIFSPVGDYDLDGDTDINDYLAFSTSFGSTTDLRADGNNNGVVDTADYTIWRDAFVGGPLSNASLAGPRPRVTAVPEPVGLLLATAGVTALAGRRQRRAQESRP